MRTLRLSLAGTVILVLLGGLPALAQEASPPASPSAPPAPMAMEPAVFTGEDTGARWRLSDPRVSGPHTETWEDEATIPHGFATTGKTGGFVASGILTLEGPGGDWAGPWTVMAGYEFPTVSRILATLEGTEAYEGWAVVAWVTTPEGWSDGQAQEVEGVIYEGSAPRLEFPEPPE